MIPAVGARFFPFASEVKSGKVYNSKNFTDSRIGTTRVSMEFLAFLLASLIGLGVALSYEEADKIIEEYKETGKNLQTFRFSTPPVLRVVFETWSPHVLAYKDANDTLQCSGPMGDLLNALKSSINVEFQLQNGDGFWGAPLPNGSWNGMMGYVHRNEVEIALGPLSVSPLRATVSDFTTSVILEKFAVVLKRPRSEANPLGFVSPFQYYLWVVLLFSMVATVITRVLMLWIVNTTINHDIKSSVWAMYGLMISQNVQINSDAASSKIFLGTGLLTMIVIARSYSGSLMSMLAVKNIPVKYNNLKDVIADNNLNLYMEGSTTLTSYMTTVESGTYKDLYEATLRRGFFSPASTLPQVATEGMQTREASLLIEATSKDKIISDDFTYAGECNFYSLSSYFWTSIYSIGIRKGSNFKELIDTRILSIKESGLYDRWASQQMPNKTFCSKMHKQVTVHRAYGINDIWVVFCILVVGLLLSTSVFFYELVCA